MRFEIRPYEGAGKLHFGMRALEVKGLLGEASDSFFKLPSDILASEQYETENLFIYYKEPGNVEAIEFYPPAKVFLESTELFSLSYEELKTLLLTLDPELEVEVDSLTSYRLGIGAYTPNAEEDSPLPAESIIAFEKGYYEEA
jgi:hypothetical protein